MEIYIEYVLIDNLVINALILLCVKNVLKLKTNKFRIFLSALLGSVISVVLPIFQISNIFLIFIKIALGILMVLTLSSFKRLKDFIFAFICFILFTFVLVGACLVTLLAFGTDLQMLKSGGYDISLPLGIILLIVAVYVKIIIWTVKHLSRRSDMVPFIRKVKIFFNDKIVEFDAFMDSGNKLFDKKTNLPVVIISLSALEKHFDKNEIDNLMIKKQDTAYFKNVHQINYSTISGDKSSMVVFNAQKIVIKQLSKEYITSSFIVGVTLKEFNDAYKYDILLPCALNQ